MWLQLHLLLSEGFRRKLYGGRKNPYMEALVSLLKQGSSEEFELANRFMKAGQIVQDTPSQAVVVSQGVCATK